MKTINVAINGFGRVGRLAFRAGFGRKHFNIVALNDVVDSRAAAYLLKYDTAYGAYDKPVTYDAKNIIVAGQKIAMFNEKDPGALPWAKLKIDVVLECTGKFTKREGAKFHLKAGAKKVIISAPAKSDDVPTYVLGVNSEHVKKESSPIISMASCTTNCIAPVMAVLDESFGVERSLMTTIHAYTAEQNLQDGAPRRDLRQARAAAENMIPTLTGAAVATAKVIPNLRGKFDGLAIRVPRLTVSLSDINAVLKKSVTKEDVNKVLIKASSSARFKGILAVTEEELVSSDFIGNTYSSIVDLKLTNAIGNLVKVIAWYDNEWGYSHRLVEMAEIFGS